MRDIELEGFRMIADAMAGAPTTWQWIGPHMSQRMFGITEERAREYVERHGGKAQEMTSQCPGGGHDWMQPGDVCPDCGRAMVRQGLGYVLTRDF